MEEKQLEKDYIADLETIKETIKENRYKTLVVVNSAMILTYHKIGTIVNERKEWGNKYIQRLANDLKEYGSGYSYTQLKRMSQFARLFTVDEIGPQPVGQIPWSSINEIISKSSSKEEMLWYINQTYQNKWSRRIVNEQFKLHAYERKLIAPQVSDVVKENRELNEIFKDTLALDFLGPNDIKDERSLKEKVMDNILSFLQELGPGFALVGKEYKLVTPTNKNFYIDLLLYHTKIHAYIVIEVKIGELEPSDFGQLHFYINAVDDLEKTINDNPTVGLLLCKNADHYVVETSLKGLKDPLVISKYKVLEDLPTYLIDKMKRIE